ncbi:MAG: hypothetical protein EOL87_08470 [Spartobacteria bacterium]|nr:hypothetical protein [Spartobacteria bacterium]
MQKKKITGIELSSQTLDVAVMSKRGRKDMDLVSTKTKSVVWPALDDESFAKVLRKVLPGIDGKPALVLTGCKVLYRVMILPSTDPDELKAMVELQVDKCSPFASEKTVIGYEILSSSETESHVLVAIVESVHLEKIGQLFRKAGVIPYRLDLPELIWLYSLKQRGCISPHGQQSVLLIDTMTVFHAVFHYGNLVLCRDIGDRDELVSAEGQQELIDELEYSQTIVEAEWDWAEEVKFTLLARGGGDQLLSTLTDRLRAHNPHGFEIIDLDSLPALSEGVARRSLDPSTSLFNLVPMTWHEAEHRRRNMRRFFTMMLILFIVWGCGIGTFSYYVAIQQQKIDLYMQDKETLDTAVSMVRRLKEKSSSIDRYADRSKSALECLREICVLLPNGVELTSFVYKKGKEVNLKGQCDRAEPIHDFIALMEKSPLFQAVKTESIAGQRKRGVVRTDFNLSIQLFSEDAE